MKALIINCSPVKNGATAEMVKIVAEELKQKYDVKSICIDDYKINFCKGCRTCHQTASCNLSDDFLSVVEEFENAEPISFLNNMFCKDRKNLENYLNVISKYREYFGYDEGSCIWSDAREWFNDKEPQFPNTYQIFGHSQLRSEPIVTQWWADLDCRRAFRLNEENGNIEELDGAEKIKECIS